MEEAEAARHEAKAAKEQMAKFKLEYGKRFEHLKAALKKFRENNPETSGGEANLVTSRYVCFSRSAVVILRKPPAYNSCFSLCFSCIFSFQQ